MAERDGRRLLRRSLLVGDAAGGDVTDDAVDDGVDDRDAFDRVTFTDEELTELALEAPPFDPFDPEVEPFEPPPP